MKHKDTTESEAIKELHGIRQRGAIIPQKIAEAIDMAIKALKKQIPIEPYIEGDGYADGYLVYDTWICPNCDTYYEIGYDDYDYCPCCGQHIDKIKLN